MKFQQTYVTPNNLKEKQFKKGTSTLSKNKDLLVDLYNYADELSYNKKLAEINAKKSALYQKLQGETHLQFNYGDDLSCIAKAIDLAKHLPQIKTIYFGGVYLKDGFDEIAENLCALPNLESLTFKHCDISDFAGEEFKKLAKSMSLKKVEVINCELNYKNCKAGEEALKECHLQNKTTLVEILKDLNVLPIHSDDCVGLVADYVDTGSSIELSFIPL